LAGEPEYRKRISSGAKDSGYGAKTKSPFVHYVLRVGVLGPLLSTIKNKWWYYLVFLGVNRGILGTPLFNIDAIKRAHARRLRRICRLPEQSKPPLLYYQHLLMHFDRQLDTGCLIMCFLCSACPVGNFLKMYLYAISPVGNLDFRPDYRA